MFRVHVQNELEMLLICSSQLTSIENIKTKTDKSITDNLIGTTLAIRVQCLTYRTILSNYRLPLINNKTPNITSRAPKIKIS